MCLTMHYVFLHCWPVVFFFYIHWSLKCDHETQFFSECYRVMFSDFYPGFIQPHAVLQHNSTLTTDEFGSFISFFPSSHGCCSFSHHLFPVWKEALHVCFGPGHSVLLQVGECQTLSSWVHLNCHSPLFFPPSLLLHLPLSCFSSLNFTFLHLHLPSADLQLL